MIETLLACSILLNVGFLSGAEYNKYLDSLFNIKPDSDLLLELEWCSFDTRKTITTILNYCEKSNINYSLFGRFLLKKLREIYFQDNMKINTFGSKIYEIWKLIPDEVQNIEPFWIMSYADDPLSWGDEQQTRELYENMFNFYREK